MYGILENSSERGLFVKKKDILPGGVEGVGRAQGKESDISATCGERAGGRAVSVVSCKIVNESVKC